MSHEEARIALLETQNLCLLSMRQAQIARLLAEGAEMPRVVPTLRIPRCSLPTCSVGAFLKRWDHEAMRCLHILFRRPFPCTFLVLFVSLPCFSFKSFPGPSCAFLELRFFLLPPAFLNPCDSQPPLLGENLAKFSRIWPRISAGISAGFLGEISRETLGETLSEISAKFWRNFHKFSPNEKNPY